MIVTRYSIVDNSFVEERIEWVETTSLHPLAKMLRLPEQDIPGIYMPLSQGNLFAASGNVTNDYYEQPLKDGLTLMSKEEFWAGLQREGEELAAERKRLNDEVNAAAKENPPLSADEISRLRAILSNGSTVGTSHVPNSASTQETPKSEEALSQNHDKLARIKHIGPATERKLNQRGVYTFKGVQELSLREWIDLGATSNNDYPEMLESVRGILGE